MEQADDQVVQPAPKLSIPKTTMFILAFVWVFYIAGCLVVGLTRVLTKFAMGW